MEQLPPSNHPSFRSSGGDEGLHRQQPSANSMEYLEQQRRAAVIQAAQERKCCGESAVFIVVAFAIRPSEQSCLMAGAKRLKMLQCGIHPSPFI
jgi:hypothetical protein